MSNFNVKLYFKVEKTDGSRYMDALVNFYDLPYDHMVMLQGQQVSNLVELNEVAKARIAEESKAAKTT